MLFVLQSGCHNRWSSNEVTSSPRKFQTATVRFLKVRNNWFSYKKIKADGVMNSVLFTSISSAFRTYEKKKIIHRGIHISLKWKSKAQLTSRIWRFSFSCLTRSFSLNCSMKSTFLFRWSRWLNDLRTVPSSMDRILRGTWPLARLKINNMMPGLEQKN